MKKCNQCGTWAEDSANFCGACGAGEFAPVSESVSVIPKIDESVQKQNNTFDYDPAPVEVPDGADEKNTATEKLPWVSSVPSSFLPVADCCTFCFIKETLSSASVPS